MAQIKKDTSLRKAILQAAIIGELTSNSPRDFASQNSQDKLYYATGKQLLDRIIEERNKKLLAEWEEAVKKNPKAKKPALVVASEIDEDDIPFEIPENWCWCRLGDICIAQLGKTLDKVKNKGEEVPYLCSINVNWGKIDLEKVKTLKLEESEKQKYLLAKGDLLICEGGDVGRSAIWDLDEVMYYQNALHRVRFFLNLNQKYFYYVLFQYKNLGFLDAVSKGMTIKHLVQGALLNLTIPFPPLTVQNAIVEKLEQVLPLVDAYENAVLQKEELKSTLPDKVKKAILQEAITGKLTETWRKTANITENGKQLLDRIITEQNEKALAEWEEALKKNPKAKKPAPIIASEIEEDEIPFEIPESWCWCRLGDLGDFVRGSGIKRDETRPEGYPCIRYGEMYTKYRTAIKETVSFVDKDVFDKCQKIIKNDIAMALTGENEYDIALAAVYQGDKEVAMGGDMTRLRPVLVNSMFLVFALNSPYGIECKSELATGNIIVHISNDKLGSIMIPLPPLKEQEEIVKKGEELLAYLKNL